MVNRCAELKGVTRYRWPFDALISDLDASLPVGPGEAGKSTLIKQMQLIHGEQLDLE